MRNFISVFLLVLVGYTAYGQQRPLVSQYMFNGLLLNPAYAGIHHEVNSSLIHRQQWINVEGAPSTSSFTFHTDIPQYQKIGLGLVTSLDRIGVHTDVSVYSSYSYKLDITQKSKLAMGLQLGFNQVRSDYTLVTAKHPEDPYYGQVVQDFKPNVGVGFMYYTELFYVGASVPYILSPEFVENPDIDTEARSRRNYYLTVGQVFDLSRRIKLKGSTLLRFQEGQAMGFDLNGNVYFDDVIAFGASLRSEGTLIALFEVKLNDNLRFGYAFDYTAGKLDRLTDGSHELMVNYRFQWPKAKNNDQLCPTYF